MVVGIVVGSLAAVFVLLVVAGAMLKEAGGRETTTPVAIPTFEPPERATREPVEPTRLPTERPTRRQDTGQDSDRNTSQNGDDQQTVNPPKQVQVDYSLKTNSLYRSTGLPRLTCRAGNASIYSHSQLKALILKTGKCMDRAWAPVLERVGIQWSPPGYAIAPVRGRGACGDYPSPGSMVPYYCPRNNTIYASTSAMARGNGRQIGYGDIISWHGGIISMMAHEYGHHVQNLSGILGSHWRRHLDSSSQSGRLALSRRLELQATCFAGMWMRSVASSYPVPSGRRAQLFAFYSRIGDHPGWPRDHGSPANNYRWFRQGWERTKPYQCNTWLASAESTS